MKKTVLTALLSALGLALLVTLAASCGDNGTATADGGVDARVDAKLDTSPTDVAKPDSQTDVSPTETQADTSADASPTDGTPTDQVPTDGPPSTFKVGGTIAGLTGGGLVLQNNAGDNLTVAANATTFAFAGRLAQGAAYAVTVLTQPSVPAQTCTIAGGSGQVGTADITNIAITCVAKTFTVGGTISGLTGGGLVLRNNGGDNLTVSANATTFTFATPVPSGGAYAVTVLIQPSAPTQTCTVASGSGTVTAANVANIAITCATRSFTVGGTVSGLVGAGLNLRNNGGDTLVLAASSTTFTFQTSVTSNAAFAVTVFAQPTTPAQTCTVSGGTGVVGAANVTSVVINCSAAAFTIGGTVNGLHGTVILHNGTENQTVTTNGGFAFPTPVATGGTYAVTVSTQPSSPHETCLVATGSGTVAGANVTNVTVTCTVDTFRVRAAVTGLSGSGLVLRNGADSISFSGDGTISFPTPVDSGTSYSVSVSIQPTGPTQICSVAADGSGVIAGADVTATVTCVTSTFHVRTTVTGLTGTGLVLHNGADDVPVATNSTFNFPTAVASGGTYLVTVQTQPSGQVCTVSPATATPVGATDATATVTCTLNSFTVRAAVSGLAAGDSVILHNGADNVTVMADGTFPFPTKVMNGNGYLVTATDPTAPISQHCAVTAGGPANIAGADVTATVLCTTNSFAVKATVTGLAAGDTVVLSNGAANVPVTTDSTVIVSAAVLSGAGYQVTATDPTAPISQHCAVMAGGPATIGNTDVTATVVCTINSFAVKATVTGLGAGDTLVLHNGAVDATVTTDGTVTISAAVPSGTGYQVTATDPTGPISQHCTVTAGGPANVGNTDATATVTCTTNSFAVKATVTGLAAGDTVDLHNGTNTVTVTMDGTVTISAAVPSGTGYLVTATDPAAPLSQHCAVTAGGPGNIGSTDVTATVTCTINSFSVGGMVSGLAGTGLVMQNNGGSDLPVLPGATSYAFTAIPSGTAYSVSVLDQPHAPAQICTITTPATATGTVGAAAVTNIAVACVNDPVIVCDLVDEHATTMIVCPLGRTIASVDFASWGTPTGTCGAFMQGSPPVVPPALPEPICHAPESQSVVETACLGMPTCAVTAETSTFMNDDPCSGRRKSLAVQVTCL